MVADQYLTRRAHADAALRAVFRASDRGGREQRSARASKARARTSVASGRRRRHVPGLSKTTCPPNGPSPRLCPLGSGCRARRPAHPDHDRHGGRAAVAGQAMMTGHRKLSSEAAAAARPGRRRRSRQRPMNVSQDEAGRDDVGQPLDRRLGPLGLLDHPDDPAMSAPTPNGPEAEDLPLVPGSPQTCSPSTLSTGRLSR